MRTVFPVKAVAAITLLLVLMPNGAAVVEAEATQPAVEEARAVHLFLLAGGGVVLVVSLLQTPQIAVLLEATHNLIPLGVVVLLV